MPERFERQIAYMAVHPEIGVLGTWTEDMDENDAPYPLHAVDHPGRSCRVFCMRSTPACRCCVIRR